MIGRRDFVAACIAASSIAAGARLSFAVEISFEDTLRTLADSGLLAEAGGQFERRELVLANLIPSNIIRARKSTTEIHDNAVNLIVLCEVTSRAVYQKKYKGAIWPRGKSGVTVGIGYDIGYVKVADFRKDWVAYIPAADIESLKPACGVVGNNARDLLPTLAKVSIDYDVAYKQFRAEVLPNYVGETEDKLPNTDKLSSLSLGALVSLTYNRGGSYTIPESKDPTGRYKEMRTIRLLMATKQFDRIPGEIISMQRLWANDPNARGVYIRRGLEAELFKAGL